MLKLVGACEVRRFIPILTDLPLLTSKLLPSRCQAPRQPSDSSTRSRTAPRLDPSGAQSGGCGFAADGHLY